MAVLNPRRLTYPFSEEQVSSLRVGQSVLVSGLVFTGRDRLHKYLFEGGKSPVDLRNGAIYHCGPVVVRHDNTWQVRAAGPTTSTREEVYLPRMIKEHGLRVVIGKGSMGKAMEKACVSGRCVYLHAVGGAAQILADKVTAVQGVHFGKEFGLTEAMWMLELKDFPAMVAIDSRGKNLLQKVQQHSRRALCKLLDSSEPFTA